MKTINGYPINELTTLLDQPLPPQAYKALPGAAGLTDIDAGWQRRAFNKIFGLYGIGWGFEFDQTGIDIRHEEVQTRNGAKVSPFVRVIGRFWYAYRDESGQTLKASFPVTGANSNQTGNEGYTLKGAVTNAIGFGASMLGWQESVYLNARSHSNTEGFAEGKTWADIDPQQTDAVTGLAPAPNKATPAEPEQKEFEPMTPANWNRRMAEEAAKLVTCYCKACKRVLSGTCKPAVCQCGAKGAEIVETPDVDTARRAVNKLIESKEAPPAPKQSLAEKCGFENIKHVVCVHCGYCEPVNDLPDVCKQCGTVKPWSVAPTHANMLEMSANIKAKLTAVPATTTTTVDTSAADTKTVLDEIKAACKNDRRLILSALSDAAGRTVKNYSECDLPTMQKCLEILQAGPDSSQATPTEPEPQGKAELCKAIYDIARDLKLGNPRQVIAEIGKVADKSITTAAQLNEDELLNVYRNFKERTV